MNLIEFHVKLSYYLAFRAWNHYNYYYCYCGRTFDVKSAFCFWLSSISAQFKQFWDTWYIIIIHTHTETNINRWFQCEQNIRKIFFLFDCQQLFGFYCAKSKCWLSQKNLYSISYKLPFIKWFPYTSCIQQNVVRIEFPMSVQHISTSILLANKMIFIEQILLCGNIWGDFCKVKNNNFTADKKHTRTI